MVELTTSASSNNVGGETICSTMVLPPVVPFVLGRFTYQPNLPVHEPLQDAQLKVVLLAVIVLGDPETIENVCCCSFEFVMGEPEPMLKPVDACAVVSAR